MQQHHKPDPVYLESQCEHNTEYGAHSLKVLHLLHSHPVDQAALLWPIPFCRMLVVMSLHLKMVP